MSRDRYVAAAVSNEALRHTPLFEVQQQAAGRFVPFAGWNMPVQFTGVVNEHHAVRNQAGLFDASHMGEFEVRGEEAQSLVSRLVVSGCDALTDGQGMYTVACRADGGILDDLIVFRRETERYWIVCNASNREKIWKHLLALAENTRTECEDISDQTALLALQGPNTLKILNHVGIQLQKLPSFHGTALHIMDVSTFTSRTGYTGEDGVEIFCPAEHAASLWKGLMQAGETMGLIPAGLGARDTLRLEARLSLYGNEIDESTNPFEAGLGWVVKLEHGDFVGRQALIDIKARGLVRKLVGLELVERGIARTGHPVLGADHAPIGKVTSGCPSPTLEKSIALAYVPLAMSKLGSEVLVDIRGNAKRAVVVKTPFYRSPHKSSPHP